MKSKTTVQYFSKEYLKSCRQTKPQEILQFLDDFRKTHHPELVRQKSKSKLISIKIPEDLLSSFRTKAKICGVPYQTQIKNLMKQWL